LIKGFHGYSKSKYVLVKNCTSIKVTSALNY
jgi:hypothetical protein